MYIYTYIYIGGTVIKLLRVLVVKESCIWDAQEKTRFDKTVERVIRRASHESGRTDTGIR